jgi:Fe(3+) dicitrate transport protein
LTPGLRWEHYDYERDIYRLGFRDLATRKGDTVRRLIPGLGLSVRATEHITLFTGLHRGFAPPRTKDAITSAGESLDLDAELSWNYEAGLRLRAARLLQGEVTFFRLDFQNQIITAAESGGATTTLVNGGETLHQGIETSLRVNWNQLFGASVLVFTDARYMHLSTARFTRNHLYGGNRLPYAPWNSFSLLAGVRHPRGFGFQLDASYIGDQFADNRQTVVPSADGTVGLVPSFTVWNAMVDYTVRRERVAVEPYFALKNLLDTRYIASRAPQGIQPGMFRQMNAGLRFTF